MTRTTDPMTRLDLAGHLTGEYGQPLAIQTGVAVCTPAGTPLLPLVTQTRVLAT